MAVVRMRKNSGPAPCQWYGDINEENSSTMLRRYFCKFKVCSACCGYYGPNFGQPLCITCHAFLYPDDVNYPDSVQSVIYQKSDSEDSGNEEPADFYETLQDRRVIPPNIQQHPKIDKLAECITALTSPRRKEILQEDLIESLPSEVLTVIFSFLDDFSLWSCSQVCKRWGNVVEANNSEEKWRQYTRQRWQLFKPSFIVPCWRTMYSKLAGSACCMQCLHQEQTVPPDEYSSWRTIRLRNELKALHSDPPEGIEIMPLDHQWQASITGPADSPYEGGTFFLSLQIPVSYPMRPPIVRFITKIFHPNISRHGDIGIDSIHDNWSLALTIAKILISIQSLLTDPYCHVCMEPEIGHLYEENRTMFDSVARMWTLRFAMFHRRPSFLPPPENGLNPNL